mmetsp:Transcript_62704/g.149598  ORF Transcript_62704/g.149598 Transcript_62704/m.149598 type:complete len:763 (+) Transcript_62704:56-2344(+)
MGQSVGVDRDAPDLKTLFGTLAQETAFAGHATSTTHPSVKGRFRHHVKAWEFTLRDGAVVDAPLRISGGQMEWGLKKQSSYLILHMQMPVAAEGPEAAIASQLRDLAVEAAEVCTPRGLSVAQATLRESGYEARSEPNPQEHADSVNDASSCTSSDESTSKVVSSRSGDRATSASSSGSCITLYVWNGVLADPRVKARAFAKSFEVHRELRSKDAASSMRPAEASTFQRLLAGVIPGVASADTSPLKAASRASTLEEASQAADAVRRHRNQLLVALLDDGSTQAASSSGPGGSRRFQRIGWSVWRSLVNGGKVNVHLAPASAAQGSTSTDAMVPTWAEPCHSLSQKNNNDSPAGVQKRGLPLNLPASPTLAEQASPSRGQAPTTVQSARSPPTLRSKAAGVPSLGAKLPLGGLGASPPLGGHGGGALPPALNLASLQQGQKSCDTRNDQSVSLNLSEIAMSEDYQRGGHVQLMHYRQTCSEVLKDELFISGYQIARDLECLQKHGITHVVNMAADVCDSCFPEHFTYLTYYLKDANHEDISLLFYQTLEWIQKALDGGGRVLVHCHEGISRSSTMVIAYLMWRLKLPYEAAHDRLRQVRPVCDPKPGFTYQLLVFGKKLATCSAGEAASDSALQTQTRVFRIAPHHPREPFLLLLPVKAPSPSAPLFDPRFGWVVRCGTTWFLWLGSSIPNRDAVRSVVDQQARRVSAFEDIACNVVELSEGEESPEFWEALGDLASHRDTSRLSAVSPAFDSDFNVLCQVA